MTRGPSAESSTSTTEKGPQHDSKGDHEEGDHNQQVDAGLLLLAKRIESHGTGA